MENDQGHSLLGRRVSNDADEEDQARTRFVVRHAMRCTITALTCAKSESP